jgi:hypothetical protein
MLSFEEIMTGNIKNWTIKEYNHCRLCGSTDIKTILDFGETALANSYVNKEDLGKEEFKAPLKVFLCRSCGLSQLSCDVNPDILFKNYLYESSKGLEKHFKDYASHTTRLLKLKEQDTVIGIGGNTGLLESEYNKLGLNAINVEPAKNIAEKSKENGVETVCKFFNEETAEEILRKYGHAQVIQGNNVLAHVPLEEIVKGMKILLDLSGFIIQENAYWLDTVRNKDIFQIYSEHLLYISIKPLQKFYEKHGFRIFHVEYNNVQNGSFRAYICRREALHEEDPSVKQAIKNEEEFGLYSLETYDKLKQDVLVIKKSLQAFLKKNKGKKMGIFGVPAKLLLLIKHFDIEKYFSFAVEDSDLKINKYIPNTKIKIYSRAEFYNSDLKNAEIMLVGAYNFYDQIVRNNSDYKGVWVNPFNLIWQS